MTMKTISIERKKGLLPEEFRRDHLNGAGRPVIVPDAAAQWLAHSKWTFEFFKSAFGSDFVPVGFGVGSNAEAAKLTTLAAYINSLDTPDDELPGFWVSALDMKPLRTAPPAAGLSPYLMGWHAFQRHPELYDDIKPHPVFIADWVAPLDPALRGLFESVSEREFWSVYIGPRNSLSKLHQDFWNTHSCLTQIQGRKRAILFSPDDSRFLYDGQVDPEQPDLRRFELFSQATAYECVLEPGETLFTPLRWWHHVRALEKSITVSHNFFNGANVNDYLAGLIRKLPKLARVIGQNEQLRRTLEIKWDTADFTNK
jgi:hypothetical protein